MDKKLKDHLVGGFGGGGGPLVILPIFAYAWHPSLVTTDWVGYLTMELVGIILVSIAVYFYFKKVAVK
jgi:hypothetical protein